MTRTRGGPESDLFDFVYVRCHMFVFENMHLYNKISIDFVLVEHINIYVLSQT